MLEYLFNKVTGLRSVKFAKFLRTPCFTKQLQWLASAFLKMSIWTRLTMIILASSDFLQHTKYSQNNRNRGGSRTAATSKMERFVIIVSCWKPLTIITKCSILDIAAVLDAPLRKAFFHALFCGRIWILNWVNKPNLSFVYVFLWILWNF